MPDDPLAFFITFSTYGSWLHGNDAGSVDPEHNEHDSPLLPADPCQESEERGALAQPAYMLDAARRVVVMATIRDVCRYRGWRLLACHVRTTHVHLVVHADVPPEKVMNDLKAYASRRLNESRLDDPSRKRWTRHGSTRYLWTETSVVNAVDYVLYRQGKAMETCTDVALPDGRGSDGEAGQSRDR